MFRIDEHEFEHQFFADVFLRWLFKNCNPVEFEKFITRVSGNVYQMETWTNDMGRLEKADQMDENDFLVENNLIGFRCKRKNVTQLFVDPLWKPI